MAEERLDLLIFGATGFTGKHTVKEAARLAKMSSFTWGVAGRSEEKLKAVVREFASDSANVKTIVADIKDEESLRRMAGSCKVVVNCAGPYRIYGEPVVKACIAAKAHHVDVSGEPHYMEQMQLDYNAAARQAGVYIISACGFDSIPCDIGVIFTQQKFNGEVNSIETYVQFAANHNIQSAGAHVGTWESGVHEQAYLSELRELRMKLFPKRLPAFQPKLKQKLLIHRSDVVEGYSQPFPGPDKTVVDRSQRYLYETYKIRPAQVQTYITFTSLLTVIRVACLGAVFLLLSRCECGRNLLIKYPKFFSGGFVSHEGPHPEAMEKTTFSLTLRAEGWKEQLTEATDKHVGPPNKTMVTRVSGINPVYGATCTMLLTCALTIVRESDKMPETGGVLPPGGAFAKTSIIDELNKNGIKFEVISTNEK